MLSTKRFLRSLKNKKSLKKKAPVAITGAFHVTTKSTQKNRLFEIKKASVSGCLFLMVRWNGFEPSRGCPRQPLKLVRLPIPPPPQSRCF